MNKSDAGDRLSRDGGRRPTRRRPGRLRRGRFRIQVREDRRDHHRVFDAGNDAHRPAAGRAGVNVDPEHAPQALRLGHCGPVLARRFVVGLGPRLSCCAPAPPGLGHQCPVGAVGRENAVVAGQIHPRPGHQRAQPREQIQRLWQSVSRARNESLTAAMLVGAVSPHNWQRLSGPISPTQQSNSYWVATCGGCWLRYCRQKDIRIDSAH